MGAGDDASIKAGTRPSQEGLLCAGHFVMSFSQTTKPVKQAVFSSYIDQENLGWERASRPGSRPHLTPTWPTVALHAPKWNPRAPDEHGKGEKASRVRSTHCQKEDGGCQGLRGGSRCLETVSVWEDEGALERAVVKAFHRINVPNTLNCTLRDG